MDDAALSSMVECCIMNAVIESRVIGHDYDSAVSNPSPEILSVAGHWAIVRRLSPQIVQQLIGMGAPVNARHPQRLRSLLFHTLSWRGSTQLWGATTAATIVWRQEDFMPGADIIDMTQMLIDNGADVNQVEGPGIAATAPLLLVCNNANFRMDFIPLADRVTLATMLINAGARVDTLDGTGMTALMYAVDHPPLARVLIDAGASPNVMPADMTHTPLTIACSDPGWAQRGGATRLEVVNMMIAANADVNLQLAATGSTAITAASDGPNSVICALLAAGATPPCWSSGPFGGAPVSCT